MPLIIRPENAADYSAISEVNRLAFGQDAEGELVLALRNGGFVRLSLVAQDQGRIIGHILFSRLPILTKQGVVEALSLAPMAVCPTHQRRGIGTTLVQEGLRICRDQGHRIVIVLGHPKFYPRFGFSAALAQRITAPYSGPAWMALELVSGVMNNLTGKADYPPPFAQV
ncbi:MAG: N-acetyltransferase [Phycisphaerae bacterium]